MAPLGRRPPPEQTRLPRALRRREITVIDGPFTEAKEIVGGFSIFTAASKEEALALTKQMMAGSEQDAECEVRQLYDIPAA